VNEWEWNLLEDKIGNLAHVEIDGIPVKTGDRVRLRPKEGGDILDIALRGQIAIVESIEEDYEGAQHISVVIEDDPGRDLGFGLVRAWRFGADDKRLGGIGDANEYLERYNELTGVDIRAEELDYWELAGNVGWAIGCLTQAQRHLSGQDRSVELAILGRLGAEVEYEICSLLERIAA